ncbi:hypothetical protein AVEN_122784-1 [Araneus ventricosus]|uniref:Uncharacterized protein n=1 Tax=Araneus ventricosus TaxID=182803 RepID=A0A4Y2UG19_ARAVE|nr:hypothetical protein AVEN_247088-1 [Araneus ventricosus]GBO12025.1 hypothetical protein AVEN_122784-1 [Araneus ventricosus]
MCPQNNSVMVHVRALKRDTSVINQSIHKTAVCKGLTITNATALRLLGGVGFEPAIHSSRAEILPSIQYYMPDEKNVLRNNRTITTQSG